MSSRPAPRRLLLVIAGLVVAGGAAAFFLLRAGGEPYTQFTNGLEVAVQVTLTDASGDTTIVDVPARGRAGADVADEQTVTIKTAAGVTLVDGKKAKFSPRDKRKERCHQYYNVVGSAAILAEDVVYGIGIKGGGRLLSGQVLTTVCHTWGFETAEPPKAIKTKEGNLGRNLTWIHYVGEGDWYVAIQSLLGQKPEMGDQDRIRAWNLAVAVSKADPENARLASLGPAFKQACHDIVDMFKTGPLAGKAEQDCLRNTRGLFPKAF